LSTTTISTEQAPKFTGLRLELAVAFRERRRTRYEAAVAVGRKSGDIKRTVDAMFEARQLLAEDEELVKGTKLWLNPQYDTDVDSALAREEPPLGFLAEGQRVLEVSSPAKGRTYQVLRRADLVAPVRWAVELDGSERLLLVLSRHATVLQAERLQAALEAAGATCRAGRIGAQVRGALHAHAAAVLSAATDVDGGT
jgi:hypothetical protein